MTLSGNQEATGEKTFTAPVLYDMVADGGSLTDASEVSASLVSGAKISVVGAQAEAEFRVRNTYIGVGPPDDTLGSDGDMYIQKNA
jgi:hypothetical protein